MCSLEHERPSSLACVAVSILLARVVVLSELNQKECLTAIEVKGPIHEDLFLLALDWFWLTECSAKRTSDTFKCQTVEILGYAIIIVSTPVFNWSSSGKMHMEALIGIDLDSPAESSLGRPWGHRTVLDRNSNQLQANT